MAVKHARWLAVLLAVGLLASPVNAEPVDQTLPYGEVSWSRGYVRISAMGLPPLDGTGGEAARKNAVSVAQKRLLAVVLDMAGKGGRLGDQVSRRPELKNRLRSLVNSADVRGKAFADGSVEVTLTVQTEGAGGLKALLKDY